MRPKRSKFGNTWTTVDDIKFQSKGEAARYIVLRDRQANGLIDDLRLQVRYPLVVDAHKIAAYVADFVYRDGQGVEVVEDFKGAITDVFKIKAKLMAAVHGIVVKIVTKPDAV